MTHMTTTLRVIERAGGLNEDGSLPAYAWPGGYPMYYVTNEGAVLCPEHASVEDDYNADEIIDFDINWEDPQLFCEHGERIASAYAED